MLSKASCLRKQHDGSDWASNLQPSALNHYTIRTKSSLASVDRREIFRPLVLSVPVSSELSWETIIPTDKTRDGCWLDYAKMTESSPCFINRKCRRTILSNHR